MNPRNFLALALIFWLAACSTPPVPPDWQLRAHQAIDNSGRAWLEGDSRRAEITFAEARSAIAATGQLHLAARLDLIRCAYRVAALDTQCQWDSRDLQGTDQHYARWIEGRWDAIDPQQLDARYRPLLAAQNPAQRTAALQGIADPVSRLIAAGLLFKKTEANPEVIQIALDTASAEGWRRPLLAWLRVAQERARQGSDIKTVADLQRRIDMLGEGAKPASD